MDAFPLRLHTLREASLYIQNRAIFGKKTFQYNASDDAYVQHCATPLILRGRGKLSAVYDELCDRKTFDNHYKGLGKFAFLRAATWRGSGRAAYDLAAEEQRDEYVRAWYAIAIALNYLPAAIFLYQNDTENEKLLMKIEDIVHKTPDQYIQDRDVQANTAKLCLKCCTVKFTMIIASFVYQFIDEEKAIGIITAKLHDEMVERTFCNKNSVANWLFATHATCTSCADGRPFARTFAILKTAVDTHPERFPTKKALVTALFAMGTKRISDAVHHFLEDGTLSPWNSVHLRIAPADGRRMCGWCQKRLERVAKVPTPKKCSCCRAVYYCGATCQGKDWLRHRYECTASIDYAVPAMTKKSDCAINYTV